MTDRPKTSKLLRAPDDLDVGVDEVVRGDPVEVLGARST
jgi:hypothetical protein